MKHKNFLRATAGTAAILMLLTACGQRSAAVIFHINNTSQKGYSHEDKHYF